MSRSLQPRFIVRDPVGEVLDRYNVSSARRAGYRAFVKQLVKLARKGRATVRARYLTLSLATRVGEELKKAGIEEKKLRLYFHEFADYVTLWVTATSYRELRTLYEVIYQLDGKVMDEILKALNRAGKVVLV